MALKKFYIPVRWEVWDKVEVVEETIENVVQYVIDNLDEIPLSGFPEYIDGTYKIEDGQNGTANVEDTVKYLKEYWNLSGGIDGEEIDADIHLEEMENGLYFVDGSGNRWKKTETFSAVDALEASKTLINCKNCTNCSRCSSCKECINCMMCEDCNYCRDCAVCKRCYNCEDCFNCDRCRICCNCENLKKCSHLFKTVDKEGEEENERIQTSS